VTCLVCVWAFNLLRPAVPELYASSLIGCEVICVPRHLRKKRDKITGTLCLERAQSRLSVGNCRQSMGFAPYRQDIMATR